MPFSLFGAKVHGLLRSLISTDSEASAGSGAAQVSLSLGEHLCQTAVHCHSGTKEEKKLSQQEKTNQLLSRSL